MGDHYFSIYIWEMRGLKNEVSIKIFSDNAKIENILFKILDVSVILDEALNIDDAREMYFDQKHQIVFDIERKNFLEKNSDLVDEKISSLTENYRNRNNNLEERRKDQSAFSSAALSFFSVATDSPVNPVSCLTSLSTP